MPSRVVTVMMMINTVMTSKWMWQMAPAKVAELIQAKTAAATRVEVGVRVIVIIVVAVKMVVIVCHKAIWWWW